MKKFYLFAAALFAAITINAKEITIDLSQGTAIDATLSLADGVLSASFDLTGEYPTGGVVFALDNLDVTNLAFDYKSDGLSTDWVSFLVYLEDSEGGQWYSIAADLSISSWNAEWASKSYMPLDVLWGSTTATEPVKPFKKLTFIANPASDKAGTFYIRNVKLTVPDDATAINNIAVQGKATKVVRNGQIFIVRDGKTYNALGAEVK